MSLEQVALAATAELSPVFPLPPVMTQEKSTVLIEAFANLGLCYDIQNSLKFMGFEKPTPIQEQAIPAVLRGKDVLATAQTGTGKTAAFMLPILQFLQQFEPERGLGPRVLVLAPTRELAMQIAEQTQAYSAKLKRLHIVTILGGMPYERQRQMLSKPVDVLIATPGRLMDFMRQGRLDFQRLSFFVLDEADRMLDMGFIDDVKLVASKLPVERQTLLFSATMPRSVEMLADTLLENPEKITVSAPTVKHELIEQKIYLIDDGAHRRKILENLLNDPKMDQVMVFTATKHGADHLADYLDQRGVDVDALHGDMRQNARNRTMKKMRGGTIKVLVATDIAARGIDVPGITHIINFDFPKNAEDYTHRIGRTGRAGVSGTAISFVSPMEFGQLKEAERKLGYKITVATIPGLEAKWFLPANNESSFSRNSGGFGRRGGGGGGGRGRSSRGGSGGGGGRRFR